MQPLQFLHGGKKKKTKHLLESKRPVPLLPPWQCLLARAALVPRAWLSVVSVTV